MTDNLRHWNKHADIDPRFTKPITGKAYKGTSPNPQYVIKCLTDLFGPVGEGFGWDVQAEEFRPIGDEVLHWCRIRFWHTDRENGFDSYGQTKALMKTRNGMMLDEDAPKKSLTDAIIKAASHVGIAANIFLGRWDDQKYVAQVAREYDQSETKTASAKPEQEQTRQNAPSRQTTPSGQPAPADHAISSLTNAETLDQLAAIWRDLPLSIKSLPEVAGAKDNRKAALQQAPAITDDEIPY